MLYLVATPIGNLDDITIRAVKILEEVDVVVCEDTRRTGILLNHLDLKKSMIPFNEHNEYKVKERIIGILKSGKSVALVSDAGTPVISDPGYILVKRAIEESLEFTTIPGATACINALVLSGLDSHSFVFRGFPPHKRGKRQNFLSADKDIPYTLIYYESPYRIEKFLNDAIEVLGNRRCSVANDLTKMYETVYRGNLEEVLEEIKASSVKGEFVVVIEGLKK
jgi:16S rRNA (cytidine1402-2'-O)-methyltransferase